MQMQIYRTLNFFLLLEFILFSIIELCFLINIAFVHLVVREGGLRSLSISRRVN